MRLKPEEQAKVAFLLSLWPFVLFASFLGAFYIILIGAYVAPAPSGGTLQEAVVIFIILTVRSPVLAVPVISALIGVFMSIRIPSGVDRKVKVTASWAAVFGFASLALYAYLLFSTTGFGA